MRNIVSYQCFAMFSSVDKLGNTFVRNIVSYQCFVMFSRVDKLGKHFCEKHCFLSMLCHVFQCGQTRKQFCEKHCFLSMLCHVFQCGQTRKQFCEKHCFLSMLCHVFSSVDKLGNTFVRDFGFSHVVAFFIADLQSGNQYFSSWRHWKHTGKLGRIVSATKMFLRLFGNNFVSATMFPQVAN